MEKLMWLIGMLKIKKSPRQNQLVILVVTAAVVT